MKKLGLLFCLAVGLSSTAIAAGDPEAGKTKSVACAACHGNDGNSAIDMNPKLAGQHAAYLVKQLKEFKLAAETGGSRRPQQCCDEWYGHAAKRTGYAGYFSLLCQSGSQRRHHT